MMGSMNNISIGLLLLLAIPVSSKEIQFGGFTWSVRAGRGGPGPNQWDENNAWIDAATNLHLKISQRDGKWACAEITMKKRLSFGRYEFQIASRLDDFDDNVVLGLFNYPTGDVGPDGTHEIDIEFARWGEAKNPLGNFTAWPAEKGLKHVTRSFPFNFAGSESTHRFTWRPTEIVFQSLKGLREDDLEELNQWLYRPQTPTRFIAQKPMPVHLNLWLFKGRPPKNGKEVEVIVRAFKFMPE